MFTSPKNMFDIDPNSKYPFSTYFVPYYGVSSSIFVAWPTVYEL